jgi:hypothetical protein
MTIRETDVESYLKEQVELRGGKCVKLQRLAGWPDRLVIIPGRTSHRPVITPGRTSPYMGAWYELAEVWFIELKRPKGGSLSRVQKAMQRELGLYGIGCRVANIKSKQEVDAWVEANMRSPEDGACHTPESMTD